LPTVSEQRRIISTLGVWDQAITLTERLIAAKQQLRRGLMQQLLTGKRRFPGCSEPWPKRSLGEFLSESRIAGSHGGEARKLTVKLHGKGVREKNEIRRGSSNTRYYIRRAGQFIYSKLDFLNGAFGIIPEALDEYESTLDLPAFDVSEELNARFLVEFVGRPHYYQQQVALAEGGRKARRVNPPEFLALKIPVPAIHEQERIIGVAEMADRELTLLQSQLTALQTQKRGLMQQLLTGKVRVPLPAVGDMDPAKATSGPAAQVGA
jgi:type I restriction enzyme S subunit